MTDTRERSEARAFIHGMWANVAGAWGANADDVDRRTAPITRSMLDAVHLRPGDDVLELASGPGGAGLAAAEQVGREGEVVISDVVEEMVEIAHARARARHLTNVRTQGLDLEDIAQPDGAYDVVLCREGLMFALDPAHAVREVYRVLRPTGRAAVAVWAARQHNPWLGLLLDAVADVTGIVLPPPGAPGPFGLSDADGLRRLFIDAGFTDITLERVAAPLRAPSFAAWWQRNLTIAGPVVAVLDGLDDATTLRLQDHLREAVTPYETAGALELPGLALVVSARRA